MSKILNFPKSSTTENVALKNSRHKTEDPKRKADAIRDLIMNKPRVESIRQRKLLAKNLWKILSSIKHRGHNISDVLREAKLGDELSSTKPLYNYTLNPDREEPTGDQALEKRLTKKFSKYLNILNAASIICGSSKDNLLLQFVSGTEYDASLPEDVRTLQFNCYEETCESINSIGNAVIKKYGLKNYLKSIELYEFAYDLLKKEFVDVNLTHTYSSSNYLPTINVCSYYVDKTFSAKVEVKNESDGPGGSQLYFVDVSISEKLFISPFLCEKSNEIEMCFVNEIFTELSSKKDGYPTDYPYSFFGYPRYGKQLLRQTNRLGNNIITIELIDEDFHQYFQQLSQTEFSEIKSVNPATCALYLSRCHADHRLEFEEFFGWSIHSNTASITLENANAESLDSPAPLGSVARALDFSILTDGEHRFDRMLSRRIETLLLAFDKKLSEKSEILRAARQNILKELE